MANQIVLNGDKISSIKLGSTPITKVMLAGVNLLETSESDKWTYQFEYDGSEYCGSLTIYEDGNPASVIFNESQDNLAEFGFMFSVDAYSGTISLTRDDANDKWVCEVFGSSGSKTFDLLPISSGSSVYRATGQDRMDEI